MEETRVRKPNQGFSLVELLVAFVILSIIVVPLLQAFVMGSRTNRKAREVARATTAAENLMEELKSAGVGDILRAVNGYAVNESGESVEVSLPGTSVFEAGLSGGDTYTALGSGRSVVENLDADGNLVSTRFRPNASGTYRAVLREITEGTETYDAVVSIIGDSTKTVDSPFIPSMTGEGAGYYAQDPRQAAQNAEFYAQANAAYTASRNDVSRLTAEEFLSSMTRKVEVDIDRSVVTGSVTVMVNVTYDCGQNLTDPSDRYRKETAVVFDSYGSDRDPESIYLYYYPLYNVSSTPRDSFVIRNNAGTDTRIILICMPEPDTWSAYNEQQYKVNLELLDGIPMDPDRFNTTILSNLAGDTDDRFRKEDHNASLFLTVNPLGNTRSEEVLYYVEVSLYQHRDASFTTDGMGRQVFRPQSSDYVTGFTSSQLDSSVTRR